jgi:hypothetical protein
LVAVPILSLGLAVAIKHSAWLRIAFVVFLGLAGNGFVFYWLMGQGISQRVFLRDLFFSEILTDVYLRNETEINQKLSDSFKKDESTQGYVDYLHTESLRSLSFQKGDDRSIAIAITDVLGTPDGSVCGLETLGKTVFDTRRGKGCCSDFSKSFLFYANYLGLQAREVSLFNHTTVEYLNRSNGRWQWLDPFYRVEIIDAAGHPLSLFQIRQTPTFEALTYRKIGTSLSSFDVVNYAGYAPAQMGTILWRRGTNFLEVDTWDRTMQGWGFSKSLRQTVMLAAGVQPHWLMVTTHSDTFYYKTLRAMLRGAACCWLVLNLALFFVLLKMHPVRISPEKS